MKLTYAFAVAFVIGACASRPPPKKTEAPARTVEPEPTPAPTPAHDDGLQVQGTVGTVKEDEVEQTFKQHFSELTACITTAKQKFRWVGGTVEVKVRLDEKGTPKAVYLARSTLGHHEAEQCLLHAVGGLHFPPPKGGKEAEFEYPVDFGSPPQVGQWEGSRLEARLAAIRGPLKECRRRGGKAPPTSLALTVYVGPGGKVLSAGLASTAPIAAPVAECVVAQAQRLRLEDPLGRVMKAQAAVE